MSEYIDHTYKRVEEVINHYNLNVRSFEERVGVSNNSIGTAIRRHASFKSNVLNKILQAFPQVNPTWLLTGQGEMLLHGAGAALSQEPNLKYELIKLNSQVKTKLIELLLEDVEVKEALTAQIDDILNK